MNVARSGLFVATVLTVSFAGQCMHAQGLGGLVNKVKEKANSVSKPSGTGVSAAAAQAQEATGGVKLDESGHPSPIHPESLSTPERERALAAAVLNDPKPGSNINHDGEEYKKLKEKTGFAPVYSADDGFFTKVPNFENRANYYIGFIDHVSEEFRLTLGSTWGGYLKEALPKIKEVHFVGTGEDYDSNGPLQGWKYAFDKNTGTLSIFFGKSLQTWSYDHLLSQWVAKNVQ